MTKLMTLENLPLLRDNALGAVYVELTHALELADAWMKDQQMPTGRVSIPAPDPRYVAFMKSTRRGVMPAGSEIMPMRFSSGRSYELRSAIAEQQKAQRQEQRQEQERSLLGRSRQTVRGQGLQKDAIAAAAEAVSAAYRSATAARETVATELESRAKSNEFYQRTGLGEEARNLTVAALAVQLTLMGINTGLEGERQARFTSAMEL